ncbi:MAG TPA: hypothetical protein VMT50_04220 [Steroidobacteraceae bacterium]|nr:hypothetical protein [Steroidobacteraceae bacterium]
MSRILTALVMLALMQASAGAAEPDAGTPAKPAERKEHAVDRLQLDPTAVTGNRELPKVMSIVPWKAAEPANAPDRPMGSLVDEVLTPVDPAEFRREIAYYRDLTSHTATVVTPGAKEP